VRAAYRELAAQNSWVVIDGGGDAGAVTGRLLAAVGTLSGA
jgi:hypothetical protein